MSHFSNAEIKQIDIIFMNKLDFVSLFYFKVEL